MNKFKKGRSTMKRHFFSRFSGAVLILMSGYGCAQLSELPVRPQTAAAEKVAVANVAPAKLRVGIVYSQKEDEFGSKLATVLTEKAVLEQADLVSSRCGDAVVSLKPEFELKDKSGNYYRIICKQVEIVISANKKICAVTTITPKPMRRQLNIQDAKDQYIDQVTAAAIPFIKAELQKLSQNTIAVSVVDFAFANWNVLPGARSIAPKVAEIEKVIKSIPGVIEYSNAGQNNAKAVTTFRIVYYKDAFPQGLVNALNQKLVEKEL